MPNGAVRRIRLKIFVTIDKLYILPVFFQCHEKKGQFSEVVVEEEEDEEGEGEIKTKKRRR